MQRSEALEEFGLDPSFNENLRDFINISFQAGAGRGDSLLDVCSLAHFPRCPPVPSYSEQFLPTRLIDLENPECPRLVLAAEIRELMRISSVWTDHRYACLSHQWGRASMPTIATLTSNINSRLVGFKLDELPQRYREAMALCFVLKIRYMWIDFVCIVQDSIRDWKSESSMMGQVYEQGILTICIDKSIDDQQWRPPAPSEWILKPGETDRDDSWLSEMLCNGPLAHRAWCLQERYLSPRIIHMLENCWIWECNSVLRTSALRSEIIPIGKSWRKLSPNQGSPAFRRKSALFSWEDIIIDYSKRQLTYDSDKLPAISGIADKLQRDIGGRYLAGIWETDLCGLLWYCGNKPIRCKLDSIPPPKSQIPVRSPKTYRAPTWSWASLDEPVKFLPLISGFERSDAIWVELRSVNIVSDGNFSELLGQLQAGSRITLAGYWWPEPTQDIDLFFDVRSEVDYPHNVSLFVIGALSRRFSKKRGIFGLILTRTSQVAFTRIGVFKVLLDDNLSNNWVSRGAQSPSQDLLSIIGGKVEVVIE